MYATFYREIIENVDSPVILSDSDSDSSEVDAKGMVYNYIPHIILLLKLFVYVVSCNAKEPPPC